MKGMAWVLAGVALIAAAPLVPAQERTGPNLATERGGVPGGVAQLALAQDLFALGAARKDPVAVLAAARLASGVVLRDMAPAKVTGPIKGRAIAETGAGREASFAPRAMLNTARQLAGNDEAVLTLVERAEAEAPDGSVTAARAASVLGAGQQDVWTLPFFGGNLAEIAVIGDGDTDLDLRISDQNGTTICANSSTGDTDYCNWVPAWNGYFTVSVANLGPLQNSYVLLSN